MNNINEDAIRASKDSEFFEEFLQNNRKLILKSVYYHTKKYISESDDEWSIAIIAFSDSVKTYNMEKGSFYTYMNKVIGNRLIDHYRRESKFSSELSVDPYIFQSNPNGEDITNIEYEVNKTLISKVPKDIKYEINSVNDIFLSFNFTFLSLAKCSPKSAKTRLICKKTINYILNEPVILNQLFSTKLLPLKFISKNLKVPRKTLENHRKYIIAGIIILHGDYPLLSEYFEYIKKDGD